MFLNPAAVLPAAMQVSVYFLQHRRLVAPIIPWQQISVESQQSESHFSQHLPSLQPWFGLQQVPNPCALKQGFCPFMQQTEVFGDPQKYPVGQQLAPHAVRSGGHFFMHVPEFPHAPLAQHHDMELVPSIFGPEQHSSSVVQHPPW